MVFVVAKMNFFDNNLEQFIYNSNASLLEIYSSEHFIDFGDTLAELSTIEDYKQAYFDADMLINIIQVPD